MSGTYGPISSGGNGFLRSSQISTMVSGASGNSATPIKSTNLNRSSRGVRAINSAATSGAIRCKPAICRPAATFSRAFPARTAARWQSTTGLGTWPVSRIVKLSA
ncbi:MAG: hypothetical protein CMM10_05470 [Rhodospirillaceae bacterium]|nr:hypothetical protein [Rhodospirillaceae bacterium]